MSKPSSDKIRDDLQIVQIVLTEIERYAVRQGLPSMAKVIWLAQDRMREIKGELQRINKEEEPS